MLYPVPNSQHLRNAIKTAVEWPVLDVDREMGPDAIEIVLRCHSSSAEVTTFGSQTSPLQGFDNVPSFLPHML